MLKQLISQLLGPRPNGFLFLNFRSVEVVVKRQALIGFKTILPIIFERVDIGIKKIYGGFHVIITKWAIAFVHEYVRIYILYPSKHTHMILK